MRTIYNSFILTVLMLLFNISSTWGSSLIIPQHTPQSTLELQSEGLVSGSYRVAGIAWLPDWQWESRGFSNNTQDDKGGGDSDKIGRCGTYGMVEACSSPKVSTGTVKPVVGLVCQKACVCPTSYQYTTSNCLDSAGKMLTGITCNGKYASCVCKPTVSLGAGEQCTLSCNGNCVAKTCKAPVSAGVGEVCSEKCASNSSLCTAKTCKPTVSLGTGEVCSENCASGGACTFKKCKPAASVGTGEVCSEKCASSGACTAKVCKPAVSVSASEVCTQSCASNSAVCTAKSCKSAVGVGTGETCTQYCGSTCTAKGCKSAITINNSWACNERCASNTVVCTSRYCPFGTNTCGGYNDTAPKSGSGWSSSSCQRTDASSCTYGAVMYANSCTRQCYDSYTASLPANASYTTSPCSDCSGVYSLKTGWNCNSGYIKAGSGCVINAKCSDGGYDSSQGYATCTAVNYKGLTCYKDCKREIKVYEVFPNNICGWGPYISPSYKTPGSKFYDIGFPRSSCFSNTQDLTSTTVPVDGELWIYTSEFNASGKNYKLCKITRGNPGGGNIANQYGELKETITKNLGSTEYYVIWGTQGGWGETSTCDR